MRVLGFNLGFPVLGLASSSGVIRMWGFRFGDEHDTYPDQVVLAIEIPTQHPPKDLWEPGIVAEKHNVLVLDLHGHIECACLEASISGLIPSFTFFGVSTDGRMPVACSIN